MRKLIAALTITAIFCVLIAPVYAATGTVPAHLTMPKTIDITVDEDDSSTGEDDFTEDDSSKEEDDSTVADDDSGIKEPGSDNQNDNKDTNLTTGPKTGDNSNLLIYILLAAGSVITILICSIVRKSKNGKS